MSKALYEYTVLSPIKYAGTVVREGTIELPEAIGDAHVASGHLAVAAAKAATKTPAATKTAGAK